MRKSLLALVAVACLAVPGAGSAQTFEIGPLQVGPNGIRMDDGRGHRQAGGQCEELRLACANKSQLGEQGEGNCRRYRESCRR